MKPLFILLLIALAVLTVSLAAQDRLKTMPGYEQYQKIQKETSTAIKSGAVAATWSAERQDVRVCKDGKRYRFDVATSDRRAR